MPPAAASACEYASPAMPLGSVAVEIDSAGSTVIESARVAVWLAASPTWTVNACVSAAVGVPLMTPVPRSRLRPAGSAPTVTVQPE